MKPPKDEKDKLQDELNALRQAYKTLALSNQKNELYLYNILRADLPGVTFYWMDKNSTVLGCNRMQATLFGLDSPADFIGKDVYYLGKLNGWDRAVCDKIRENDIEVMRTGETISHEENVSLYGKQHVFLSYKTPLQNEQGKVLGIFGFSVDITPQKKAELLAIKAKNAAEMANTTKTEFIRNMSHDLRTPLSGIIGISSFISDSSESGLIKEYAQDIHQAGTSLLHLLDEIIETAELDSPAPAYEKSCFELKKVYNDIVNMFKPALQQKGITLTQQYDNNIPDFFFGEALLLDRILLNLLGNAVKFTEKGNINFAVALLKKANGRATVKFTITDSGIGIPEDKISIIFDKFTRVSSAYGSNTKGSGLGLYLVKRFCDYLGGTIDVNSTLGVGSTFTVTVQFLLPTPEQLPQNPQATPSPDSAKTAKNNLTQAPAHVLLIEDTKLPRIAAQNLLSTHGFIVETAESATEAIGKLAHAKFDIIYMDIGLPDGDGLDITKSIRQNPGHPNNKTFIAVLSAHVGSDQQQACRDAGAQIILQKPLTEEKIIDIQKTMLDYTNPNDIKTEGSHKSL